MNRTGRGGAKKIHGHTAIKGGKRPHSPTYVSWQHMRQRCCNPKCDAWDRYGGRGITVWDAWHSFPAFLADMGVRPSPKHTLDRINPDGNYEPGNCRWATWVEQNNNKGPVSQRQLEHCAKARAAYSEQARQRKELRQKEKATA